MSDLNSRPIGQTLLHLGLITPAQLDTALAAQSIEGGHLGRHLVLAGVLHRRELYAALAKQWNAPLVDLIAEPTSVGSLIAKDPAQYANAGWIPWRVDEQTLTIATSVPPSDELLAEAGVLVPGRAIEFRATTDWDIMQSIQESCREQLLFTITDAMAVNEPDVSAREGVARWQKIAPPLLAVTALVVLILEPTVAVIMAFSLANALFFFNIAFKVLYGLRSPIRLAQKDRWRRAVHEERRRRGLEEDWPGRIHEADLPIYTILIPVYDEVEVVQKVIANLDRLDYPKSKLDVMILLEESDNRTIDAAKSMDPPEYVRIVLVPAGQPQTKPRACNYGLEFARGRYVVIYDAEDRPHPHQLRKAIEAFETNRVMRELVDPSTPRLVCVQASLMYFNANYNLLTRMFAIEYAHWFDAMLPGMDGSGLPLPLGGTSNHFETATLRELGAWDPYNVTEDADLGLRITNKGYAVGTIESATEEEACSQTVAWIKQRTRWIKGYLITGAVNTRHPIGWMRGSGWGGFMTIAGLILGTPLAFMAYPFALLFTALTYVGVKTGAVAFPTWILQGGTLMLLCGNGSMILFAGLAALRRYGWRIAVYAPLNPIYWFLHSIAAWRAAYQLVFDPHRWEKTPHGLSADYETTHA